MSDTETKCKYFNLGFCKHKELCKFLHPSEECTEKCNKNECMKRHIKACRYKNKCRYNKRYTYKHDTISQQNDFNFEIRNLLNKILDLVECQKKSDEKIKYLEEEIKSVKNKKKKKKLPTPLKNASPKQKN